MCDQPPRDQPGLESTAVVQRVVGWSPQIVREVDKHGCGVKKHKQQGRRRGER